MMLKRHVVLSAMAGAFAILTLGVSGLAGKAAEPGVVGAGATSAGAAADAFAGQAPVAVEVFISQACPACPPAADMLKDLSMRADVVALNWHVDYWDDMPVRGRGAWPDPYSYDGSGVRQRAYNMRFKKRKSVFTPQTIVNGAHSVRGSKAGKVRDYIADVHAERTDAPSLSVVREGSAVIAETSGATTPYDIVLVAFIREAVTSVSGGANAGVVFDEVNIVRDMKVLASNQSGPGRFSAETAADEGCAVLVQEPEQGVILAARYCDSDRLGG